MSHCVLNCGFPSLVLFGRRYFCLQPADGGLHARWKCDSKKSQEAFRYLAVSLVGEDVRREENLSTEADRNGRSDPRPRDCAKGSTFPSARPECTKGEIEICLDD